MTQPGHLEFRTSILLLSALLGLQCIWLVSSELSRPKVIQLPTNPDAAGVATSERTRATLAAAIGLIRGELWSQSAFTYADLLFGEVSSPDIALNLGRASDSIERALNDAPSQSAVWLLRAGIGARYPNLGFNVTEALKMSYYTGPSEGELIPLRLRLALASGIISDVDMRALVRRDLRFLLARKQQAEIAIAYNTASPLGKHFMEQAVGEIDRSALDSLLGAQKRPFPD